MTGIADEAKVEAERRWPSLFANAVGSRELERWETFAAGAVWATSRLPGLPTLEQVTEVITEHLAYGFAFDDECRCGWQIPGWEDVGGDGEPLLRVKRSAHRAHVAGCVLALVERGELVVTAAAELDALPADTVVVDRFGVPRTKRLADSCLPGGWTHAGREPLSAHQLANGHPMRVVFVPSKEVRRG